MLSQLNNQQQALDSLAVNTLRAIANLCPYTDGIAVYQARSILTMYDPYGTEYLNPCELDGANNLRIINQNTDEELLGNDLAVYPNPASDEINIKYIVKTNAVMCVYNTLGEVVCKQNLFANNSIANIKLNQFLNGIYVCEIKEDTGEIQKIKFSVIR